MRAHLSCPTHHVDMIWHCGTARKIRRLRCACPATGAAPGRVPARRARPACCCPKGIAAAMLITINLAAVLAFSAGLAALAALLLLATWRAAGRQGYLAAWAGFCGLGAIAYGLHALRGL